MLKVIVRKVCTRVGASPVLSELFPRYRPAVSARCTGITAREEEGS